MKQFSTLEQILLATAEAIRPPERLTVSQAAEKYRKLNNPGQYIGPWKNSMAPYLTEIMDEMGSLEFTGLVFAGPARCGKSDIFFNWLASTAICDPADMMLVHMTQSTARDWSQGDLRKFFRHSKDVGERVVPGRQNMNVHDIRFLSGMRLLVKWPTITELSGKTLQRVWFMDYDRMTQDVDKEGPPFDLGRKRTGTVGRYGMTVAESSPGYEIQNPRWSPSPEAPHEAPPTQGILALYNRGDRRRWQFRCVECGGAFEPHFNHLNYPDSADHVEASEMVTMNCPLCGFSHTHEPGPGQPGKHGLNLGGKWIKEGQIWLPDGSVEGVARKSDIASFWLPGVAAAFADWKSLVFKWLKANEEYEKTGDLGALKATVNTDQGYPFKSPLAGSDMLPEDLKNRAKDFGDRVVPAGVRFLISTIDVQRYSFVVQVHGISEGGDVTIIDRFSIRKSDRLDDDGDPLTVQPASYIEDWKLLIPAVIEKTYPLDDDTGRRMAVKVIGCDSAGRDGTTSMAYAFWRYLRDEYQGQHHMRFQLLKGDPQNSSPRVRMSYPDSQRKDRHAGARGEIPVMMINSLLMKDMAHAMLGREEDGGGKINFPLWLQSWFYSELTAEIRTSKGWENPKKHRNEAWDLLVYCVALAIGPKVRIERLDWQDPPLWAEEWDKNDLVIGARSPAPFEQKSEPAADLSKLGELLA